ncbi:hypothetical protein C2G38_2239941 [Gigaspora rosea]|uniref:Uncharacterized protein n=1 Tax=Gigaspora rosea TaxID=44941 RepID=A0A397W8R7_9GLOM|nr:hypothetical protein C2G38_2239941 [Gigaspora rosea]
MSQATSNNKVFNTSNSELEHPNLTDTPQVISYNVLNTRELERSNLTNMPRVTSDKIWVRRPGRGPFSFTREELQNKGVIDLDDLKKLLLIRFGYDPERTSTDCVIVCHPKNDNLRESTPINELYNDDKSALEVTITNDPTVREQVTEEATIDYAPPVSGYGTQNYVSDYGTQSKQSIMHLS